MDQVISYLEKFICTLHIYHKIIVKLGTEENTKIIINIPLIIEAMNRNARKPKRVKYHEY